MFWNLKFLIHWSIFRLAALAFLFFSSQMSVAAGQEETRKFQEVLSGWKTMSRETLASPGYAGVIKNLKAEARSSTNGPERAILLRLDDPEIIDVCLVDLRTADPSNPSRRAAAVVLLQKFANPTVIPRLADDLNRSESPDIIILGGVGLSPHSVEAAMIIRGIISRSSLFSPAVRKWSDDLMPIDEEVRGPIRTWWKLNKPAIERGDYQAVVVPPSS